MIPSFLQPCMYMLLRKHRIISPLRCSARASPAWWRNITQLYRAADPSKVRALQQVSPNMILIHTAELRWALWMEEQRLDEMCRESFFLSLICSSVSDGWVVVWEGKRWPWGVTELPAGARAPRINEILLPSCGLPHFAHDLLCWGRTIVGHRGKGSLVWDGEKRSSCKTTRMDVPWVKS